MKSRLTIFIGLLVIVCNVFAQSQIVANYKSDITAGCSPIVVNFQDLSTGNPTVWKWDFGNGATSTKKNPAATYFDPGVYTVTLIASNASGTITNKKTATITVYLPPVADFSVDKKPWCSPAVIQFTDKSSTPGNSKIVGWSWDFGDGGNSTEPNPKHIYRRGGSYTVTLTITNNVGCKKLITRPNYIDVKEGVVPNFYYPDPAVCSAPAKIDFTNTSTGPGNLSYKWDLGNGTTSTSPNTSTVYKTNGTYSVSLFVVSSEGCSDSAVRDIKVGKANTDFVIPGTICPKVPIQFINTSTPRPLKTLWRFSNGTTDTFRNGMTIFNQPGTYTITLINTYTVCTDSITKTINIEPIPSFDFKASDTGRCQTPFTVNFTPSGGVSYLWDFGDSTGISSNPTHTYNKGGEFDVTLIAKGSSGCSDTLIKPKYIKIKKPVIRFPGLPTQGCIPYPFTFSADVQSPDAVTSYKWDFGDGNSSTAKSPTHIYSKSGIYAITLSITTSTGCSETVKLEKAVKVDTLPKPAFTSDGILACAQPGIQFINQTIDPTKEYEYKWTFSDGTTSTEFSPKHTFSDTGWIDVTLSVTNKGCENRLVKTKYVQIKPSVSKFDFKLDCNNRFQYSFIDKSIAANSWSWDFGDGKKFTGKNPPIITFPKDSTYNISLTTTNGTCTYTLNKSITIAPFVLDFTTSDTQGCKPFNVSLQPTFSNPGLVKEVKWNFGDGTGSIDAAHNFTGRHTYTKSGIYDITLSALDTYGCPHSITKKAVVRVNGPTTNFTSINNSGCKGLTTTFVDSSKTDGTHSIVSWKWNFGDSATSQTSTAPPFYHRYDSVGNFDIKLLITDALGCTDSMTYREGVKTSTLKADLSTEGLTCPNAKIYFGNSSISELPFNSTWDFGDSQTASFNNGIHTYQDTGFYTVKLVVKDILGCKDSIIKMNAVHVSLPVASFTENNLTSYCVPFEGRFTNTSTFYGASLWDFTMGTSNQQHPSSYFTKKGTYPIKLVVTSPGGCKDSTSKVLNVFDESDGVLSYTPLTGCRPLLVDLQSFSEFNANFIWDFGDGNVTDTPSYKIRHSYLDPGDFVPKIILKQLDGCILTLKGVDVIQVFGARTKFSLNKNLFCDSGSITISDSTITRDKIIKYNWDFGDGTTSTEVNPTHHYAKPGMYSVAMRVETETGCKDTSRVPVKIVQSPIISVVADSVICVNDRIQHLGIIGRPDTSAIRWYWTFPNGNTSTSQYPGIQQYKQVGNFAFSAIATNSSGCTDSASQTFLVNPLPVITLPATLLKIVGIPLTLPANYSNNISKYLWNPFNTLSCPDCPQPITTTKFNTWYKVNVVDSNGCQSSAEVQVKVLCEGATIFIPNTFSPNGDGVNDVLYVRGKGLERVKSIRIFNRWGEVVFEQREFPVNDALYGWNGKYKGNKIHPDVYIYQVEILCENGELIRLDGNTALIL